eukprot:9495502-Alexandrium_andersonii.AAC.1
MRLDPDRGSHGRVCLTTPMRRPTEPMPCVASLITHAKVILTLPTANFQLAVGSALQKEALPYANGEA